MKLLLDTHIWLWAALEPARLAPRIRRLLEDPASELWLSPISVWETLILARKRRVVLEPGPDAWVRRALAEFPLRDAALTHEVALGTDTLQLGHDDPADRFLVATALVYELRLLTADARLIENRQAPTLANR